MEHLTIIGDSYADPRYKWREEQWMWMLPYEVEVIAESGVGPRWQLEHLFGREGEFLLFLLADHNRLHLPCVEAWDDGVTTAVEAMNVYHYGRMHPIKKQICDVHYAYHETGIKDIQADMYAQYILASKFKRILVWPCADVINRERINIPLTGHVVEKPLCQISDLEQSSNHFSSANHEIFAKQITRYFDYCIAPDPEELITNVTFGNFIYDN